MQVCACTDDAKRLKRKHTKGHDKMTIQKMPTALIKASELDARITAAIKGRVEMQQEEHTLLFQAVMHAQAHGDTTFIAKMLNEMPNGARVDAMSVWLKDHFPIQARVEKNDKGEKIKNIHGRPKLVFKLAKDRKPTDWQMEKAWAKPFFDYAKPKPENIFDVNSLNLVLQNYIKRGEKAVEEGKFKGTKEDFLAHKAQVYSFLRVVNGAQEQEDNQAQAA